jgi:hypothetical protein
VVGKGVVDRVDELCLEQVVGGFLVHGDYLL